MTSAFTIRSSTLRGGDLLRYPTPITTGTVTMTINGTTIDLDAGSIQIDRYIGQRSTGSIVLTDPTGTFHAAQGNAVQIWDANGNLVFGGVVTADVEKRVPGSVVLRHSMQVADYCYVADKRICAKSYTNMTCGAIVADLVANYLASEGVTTQSGATITPGPTLTSAVFNYIPVSQALDALAESAGYWWNIDNYKQLYFQPYAALPAPWSFDGSQAITETSQVTIANGLYRNSQIVTGGTDTTATMTETRQGDGKTRAFTLSYDMGPNAPTITLNGVAQTVGIKGATGSQWYWLQGDPVIAQDPSGTVLAATDTLSITYQGQYAFIFVATDSAQVTAQQTVEGGGSGLVESVTQVPTSSTAAAAAETASAKLQKYAQGGTMLEFSTKTPGLAEGQILIVNLPDHNLIGQQMLIEHVAISDPDGVDIYYDVQAVLGPIGTNWVKFFQNLANPQQGQNIDLSNGQILILVATETAALPFTAVATVTTYACSVPSLTLYPATTGLYPC
jgi:hypothetical protein